MTTQEEYEFTNSLKPIQKAAHKNSKDKGFWNVGDKTLQFPEKIALMHAELSELLEALRSPTHSIDLCEKVVEITAVEEECADLMIRLLDFCEASGVRLGLATILKMDYNAGRPHKHGKRF